jgi:hypothetical protein
VVIRREVRRQPAAPTTERVTRTRSFNLDDLGAELGQQQPAERCADIRSGLDHTKAGKGLVVQDFDLSSSERLRDSDASQAREIATLFTSV